MTNDTLQRDVSINSGQFIVFCLNNQDFAIDVMQSREILTVDEITIIPEAPGYLRGVIDLRGEIVPVVNLIKKLNLDRTEVNKNNHVIIISINETLIGIEVDGIKEIIRIAEGDINKAPDMVQQMNKAYIEGIAKIENKLLILLNLQSIFSKKEVEQLNKIDDII